ncbi:hypothetical protein IW16_26755 [Chryseobacterium vrystaatense]|uniref:Uncharacterized protein n=2 Tax=Chryseobacterium vrystaatense TaxID=307480 RepID=A0ABR4UF93_9FLAO|nr:hypothetical protein IW16_26755 [Chryseobacterium vrystaatense]
MSLHLIDFEYTLKLIFMKKILFAIFAFFFSFGLSQNYEISIQKEKYREKIGSYWTEWSGLKNTNLKIEINSLTETITLHSNPKKIYNIINLKLSKGVDNSSIRDYNCVDSSGKKYLIKFVENAKKQISINLIYDHFEYIYFEGNG